MVLLWDRRRGGLTPPLPGKEHDLKRAVKDFETRLLDVTQSLAEFKHRALTAEMALEETSTSSSRTQELEKELKDKTILNGKLRQEGLISVPSMFSPRSLCSLQL